MFIPNPKLDTMELLYPRRKPVGRVKIDWSNPLARGLDIYTLFADRHDLASGDSIEVRDWTTVNVWDFSPSKQGMSINMTPTSNNTAPVIFNKPVVTASPMAIVIRLAHSSAGGNILGITEGTYNVRNLRFRISNGGGDTYVAQAYAYGAGGSTQINLYTTIASGEAVTLVLCCDADGGMRLYASDGTSSSIAENVPFVTDELTESIFNTWAQNLRGSAYMFAKYSRELSESEARILASNPYQFLIPA